MHKRNVQRAARAIQARCGVSYTRAHQWVRENSQRIIDLIRDEDGCDWRQLRDAAAGLWRRDHPEEAY